MSDKRSEQLKRGRALKRQLRKLIKAEPDPVVCLFVLGTLMTEVARKETRTRADALALPISVFLRQAGLKKLNDVSERARGAALLMLMKEEHGRQTR